MRSRLASLIAKPSMPTRPWLRRMFTARTDPEPNSPKALVELEVEGQLVDAIVTMPHTRYGPGVVIYLVDSTEWDDQRSLASRQARAVLRRLSIERRRGAPVDGPENAD